MVNKSILSVIAFWCMLSSSLCLADDSMPANWLVEAKPFRIAGPIHYVGTSGLGVYLIKSNAGLILVSGALPTSGGLIAESIRKLGFKLEDIRFLLVSHAHFDHVGTLAHLKQLTKGSIVAMEAEAELLKSGGKKDYLFAGSSAFHFPPVSPDRLVKDGEVVSLGDVKLVAQWTPGHTPGCTTWEMNIEEGGKKYNVVFLDGTSVNPGTRFITDPSYPTIAADYKRTFVALESLHPDIFLAYHTEAFDLEDKIRRTVTEGSRAWVDPAGYKKTSSSKPRKI